MTIFNWNQQILGIPDDWRQTEGENVKIAILDSGVDLKHPGLKHLDVAGHKFNVTTSNFNPDDPNQKGEDNIEDSVPMMRAHGTHVTSIIGALPDDNADESIKGVAPKAEIYLIKITDEEDESFLDYFIKGMKIAIREKVDVISISYFPLMVDPIDQAAIDEVFKLAKEQEIAVVTTLENTSNFSVLNELQFPSTHEECIVNGVLRSRLLKKIPANPVFNPNVCYVFPELEIKFCTLFRSNKFIERKITSSYSTAALAGIVALLIGHWKKTEPDYQRRTKAEILTALHQITLPFDASNMLNQPLFQFYSLQKTV